MAEEGPITHLSSEKRKEFMDEIEKMKTVHKLTSPMRSYITGEDCKWRYGSKPDYTLADYQFLQGKTQNHAEGSLEKIVEDLVKTWEMEATHKPNVNEWKTTDQQEGVYHISSNNWKICLRF